MIGLFSDSHGDLDAFDAAYELLRQKGARRFIFAGGGFGDLDAWIARRQQTKAPGAYTNADFLHDVTAFLANEPQVPRPPAFEEPDEPPSAIPLPAPPEHAAEKLKERFLCVAEKERATGDDAAPLKTMDMLGDALCCVVHDRNDLDRDDLLNATVFVHGKEGEPKVVQIGPRYFITAGRLTGVPEPTCGLIEMVERNLRFSAFKLDGNPVVDGQMLILARATKLSVK